MAGRIKCRLFELAHWSKVIFHPHMLAGPRVSVLLLLPAKLLPTFLNILFKWELLHLPLIP